VPASSSPYEVLHRLEMWERRYARIRARHDEGLAAIVADAREAGFSWDRIGQEIGLNGETLRRRYGSGS
jgi:hypothetical protein